MVIKVYDSNICPGTIRFVSILTVHGIMPQFINVIGSIDHLKEFITFRDTSSLYNGMRGSGAIKFPLVQLEDDTYTKDVNTVLARLGIDEKMGFSKRPPVLTGFTF